MDPRIKRKIKKFFKSKWFKVIILSLGVYIVFSLLAFLVPILIIGILGGALKVMLLLKASLIINVIIYPLWLKECLRVVEKYEVARKANKARHKKVIEGSEL